MITRNRPALPAELVERLAASARATSHGPTNPDAVAAALEPFLGRRTPIHDHVAWCVVGGHRGRSPAPGTSVRRCYRMPVR
jgi:hypothetical protein